MFATRPGPLKCPSPTSVCSFSNCQWRRLNGEDSKDLEKGGVTGWISEDCDQSPPTDLHWTVILAQIHIYYIEPLRF